MSYVIYGACDIGKRAEESLKKNYGIDILGYMDTYKTGTFHEHRILDADEVDKDAYIIISVLNPHNTVAICRLLQEKGFDKLYWFYDMHQNLSERKDFLSEECFKMSCVGDELLTHAEFHISDKCNLNCKGCTHFSPLFDTIGMDFESRIKDLQEIKRIFSDVFRLDILGGEPLLNDELERYVITIREMFPDSFIQIYTNGLLIPKLSDAVLQTIRDKNVAFSISEYLPTHKMIDQIKARLNEFGIRFKIAEYDKKQVFNRPISTNSHSRHEQLCISNGCVTIADGKIARCPTLMYVYKFNEIFQQNLPTDGIYKLSEYEGGGAELLSELEKEVPLCKHCVNNEMTWSVCGKEKRFEDFATED